MKLYDRKNAGGFVFAIVDHKAREGTAPTYQCVAGDSVDTCELFLDTKNKRNAYPHCMGRYDDKGRYCVYKPPVEGVTHGRFVLHPLADEAYQVEKRELAY